MGESHPLVKTFITTNKVSTVYNARDQKIITSQNHELKWNQIIYYYYWTARSCVFQEASFFASNDRES